MVDYLISNRSDLGFLMFFLFLVVAILVSAVQVYAETVEVIYGPTKISTGGNEETPQVVVDNNGYVHIVWTNGTYLLYEMFGPNGNLLIGETVLNPCLSPDDRHVRRPSVVVDSNNNLHIVFHGFSHYTDFMDGVYQSFMALNASEVIYLKINPYLDDLDGDQADPGVITVIPEKIISTDDSVKSRAPNIAIDRFDRLHVAWFDGDIWSAEGEIHYLVMNTNGSILVSETTLASDFYTDVDWSEPEIVVDSNGNAHIFFVTEGWTGDTYKWRDVWYLMANGTDGSLLIAPTQLTKSNETYRLTRPAVAIGDDNLIHVVYHNSSSTVAAELFLLRINPYLDDLDGDQADPSVIVVSGPIQLTETDGYRSYLKNIAIDEWGREHVVWVDQRDMAPDPDWGSGELYYMIVGTVNETRITFFNGSIYPAAWWYSSGRRPGIAVSGDHVYIVFNGVDPNWEFSDIYFMILRVPVPTPPKVGGVIELEKPNTLVQAPVLLAATFIITAVLMLAKRCSRH